MTDPHYSAGAAPRRGLGTSGPSRRILLATAPMIALLAGVFLVGVALAAPVRDRAG